jgi:V/A-type H+-transporting ATPase subunit F
MTTTQTATAGTAGGDANNQNGGLIIAAMGGSDFTLGFELVGIKKIIATDNLDADGRLELITETMRNDTIGIIIMDEEILNGINVYERQQLESSIRPVVVLLRSEPGDSGTLRRQIMRAIGVDLYAHDADTPTNTQH